TLPRSAVMADLLSANHRASWVVAVVLIVADLWLTLEVAVAPRLMEFVRQLPARAQGLPPPLSWRADSFYVAWQFQALLFLLATKGRLIGHLGRLLVTGHAHWSTWLVAALSATWLVAGSYA